MAFGGSNMSMKIMDMQVLIQKTADVSKIQQVQNQESNIRQQELTNQIVAQTQQNTHSINRPPANQAKLVHEKQEQEEHSKKNRKKRGNIGNIENKEEHKQLADPNRGNNLDILI